MPLANNPIHHSSPFITFSSWNYLSLFSRLEALFHIPTLKHLCARTKTKSSARDIERLYKPDIREKSWILWLSFFLLKDLFESIVFKQRCQWLAVWFLLSFIGVWLKMGIMPLDSYYAPIIVCYHKFSPVWRAGYDGIIMCLDHASFFLEVAVETITSQFFIY